MALTYRPGTDLELREALQDAASAKHRIELLGNGSKRALGGPVGETDVRISTTALKRVLQYEPRDLTIRVEAGMPFAELAVELAKNGQMIPLDGPYSDDGTVGGVVAANTNGPRRRLYGTARDLVIGMRFATVDGRLVDTGGMVVKNVAGLDMGKLLIGSFGTLAAIASVNFKLTPIPRVERTFLFSFPNPDGAGEAVTAMLRGQYAASAIELLNPAASVACNLSGYTLALAFGGNERTMERITNEMLVRGAAYGLREDDHARFWLKLRAETAGFLGANPEGAVVRISTPISESTEALRSISGAVGSAHAGSGVVRGWFATAEAAARYLHQCVERGWDGVVEAAGDNVAPDLVRWPKPGAELALMMRVKAMFDPKGLLNRGRLFARI